jgi:hypothetical protein
MPNAAATAAPPLLPPGVSAGFHGLRVMPVSGLSVTPFQPNSGVVVLPRKTAPCSRRRATDALSSGPGCPGHGQRTAPRRPAAAQQQILHRGRQAVDPPDRSAGHPALLGRPRICQRLFGADEGEGVEARLQCGDTVERGTGHLDRRQCLRAERAQQRVAGQRKDIFGHGSGTGCCRTDRERSCSLQYIYARRQPRPVMHGQSALRAAGGAPVLVGAIH